MCKKSSATSRASQAWTRRITPNEERFDPEDIEESEASLMEIHEYIRVSVVLIMALMDEHQAQQAAD